MRWSPAILALLLLAGCVEGPRIGGAGGVSQQEVALEVTDAALRPGRCFDGATAFGEVCHVLTVAFDNSAWSNPRDTNALTWKAEDADGGIHTFGDGSVDQVAGGRKATLTVSFTLPDGPTRLVRLVYDAPAGRGEASIPAYG